MQGAAEGLDERQPDGPAVVGCDRTGLGSVVDEDFGAVLALDEPFATGQVARQFTGAIESKEAEGIIARGRDGKVECRVRGSASGIK